MPRAESGKSIEEKLAIVLEGLKESTNITELCRRHGISEATYYNWRDKFFEGGKTALAGNGSGGGRSSESDKAKIADLERVIGQQAVEIQVFKKKLKLF
jgi:putative transposase